MLRSARRAALAQMALAALLAFAMGAPTLAHAAALPDGRAYEMVSPPDKHGGDVVAESQRTRAAMDGSAVGFLTLTAFGDAQGTGVASEYIAQRSSDPQPGTNGWATHSISPRQEAPSFPGVLAQLETRYLGDFSPDLSAGVVFAGSPITSDFGVEAVANLYRRTDLRTPGPGIYQLLTSCPLCESTRTPLPPLPIFGSLVMQPHFAWASPDMGHVLFESRLNLTADAPPFAVGCDPAVMTERCRTHLYEWDNGTLRIAGILPDGSVADVAYAAQSAGARLSSGNPFRAPHTVSDGSDGHSRIFFTQPTNAAGLTSSQVPAGQQNTLNAQRGGKLFVRIDHTTTDQLNLSERSSLDAYAPARFVDASADGRRAFFLSAEALTDDAPTGGGTKLYMYDASRPGTDSDNLTFISPDEELGDGGEAVGVIGTSVDGSAVYMIVRGQLVADEDLLGADPGIYLWRDGEIAYVGSVRADSSLAEIQSTGANMITQNQARVSPDGRYLLFSAAYGAGLTGYDHGDCNTGGGQGCREMYVYSADTDELRCVSCNPSGAPATAMATISVRANQGGTQSMWRQNHALADDGSRVFFSTAEALVPDDVNGKIDAYQYDTDTGALHLLSTGRSTSDSWFMDASADGRDAFFVTRERLVGWDVDTAFDLYDARVGGGFPEPTVAPPPCSGDACQGSPGTAPGRAIAGSALLEGAGNADERLRPRAKRARRCRRGFVKRKVRGKRKCVRRQRVARRAQRVHSERSGS